jgi:hypothetical protein
MGGEDFRILASGASLKRRSFVGLRYKLEEVLTPFGVPQDRAIRDFSTKMPAYRMVGFSCILSS